MCKKFYLSLRLRGVRNRRVEGVGRDAIDATSPRQRWALRRRRGVTTCVTVDGVERYAIDAKAS